MSRRTTLRSSLVLAIILLTACANGDAAERPIMGAIVVAPAKSSDGLANHVAIPAAVIDSARPMAVLIERFQRGLARPAVLAGAYPARDSLVQAYFAALQHHDTAAVARMFITRAEFAYLYFPASDLSRPPYEIDPGLAWFQLSSESEDGVRKAFDLLGGRGATYLGSTCQRAESLPIGVAVWSQCIVRWRFGDSAEKALPLFGSIIEHRGRFKFFSYANGL